MTITQTLAADHRQREMLTASGQFPTKSLETHAPLRRPTSIGFEPGGVLREFDHRFTEVAPLRLTCRTQLEMEDLESAIAESQPDVLSIDPTAWGAPIAAEASGLPFAFFAHSPLPISSKDAPPFGLALPPARGPLGRLRDRVAERAVLRPLERRAIPKMNLPRAQRGLVPLGDSTDFALTAHRFLYYSAERSSTRGPTGPTPSGWWDRASGSHRRKSQPGSTTYRARSCW